VKTNNFEKTDIYQNHQNIVTKMVSLFYMLLKKFVFLKNFKKKEHLPTFCKNLHHFHTFLQAVF
jgi:hypothetical protein